MGWRIIGGVQDWSGAGGPFTLRLTPVVGGSPLLALPAPSAVVAVPVVYRSPDGGVDLSLPFPAPGPPDTPGLDGLDGLDGLSWRVEALTASSAAIESPPSGAPAPAVRPGVVLASRDGVVLPVPGDMEAVVTVPLTWLLLGVGPAPGPDAPAPGALVMTDEPGWGGVVIEGDALTHEPGTPQAAGVVTVDHAALTPHPDAPGVVVVST